MINSWDVLKSKDHLLGEYWDFEIVSCKNRIVQRNWNNNRQVAMFMRCPSFYVSRFVVLEVVGFQRESHFSLKPCAGGKRKNHTKSVAHTSVLHELKIMKQYRVAQWRCNVCEDLVDNPKWSEDGGSQIHPIQEVEGRVYESQAQEIIHIVVWRCSDKLREVCL